MTHDPLDFAEELGRKLATRSRHVCALFGAGVSRACGLPDVSGLQKAVAEKLSLVGAVTLVGIAELNSPLPPVENVQVGERWLKVQLLGEINSSSTLSAASPATLGSMTRCTSAPPRICATFSRARGRS